MRSGRALVFLALCAVTGLLACGLDLVGGTVSSADEGGLRDSPSSDPPSKPVPAETGLEACPLGNGRSGGLCGETCADLANDRSNCGACGVQCSPSQACEGKCTDVATALVGFRIELPCMNASGPPLCMVGGTVKNQALLGGTPGREYVLVLRFRGVIEQNSYSGTTPGAAYGENFAFFVKGGTNSGVSNDYTLAMTRPEQTFRLNAGVAGNVSVDRIGYTVPVVAEGGSELTLSADPKADNLIVRNQDVVVPGVPPDPLPFDGQFIQVDVVSVTPQTP